LQNGLRGALEIAADTAQFIEDWRSGWEANQICEMAKNVL
jgi:hypothetical protein